MAAAVGLYGGAADHDEANLVAEEDAEQLGAIGTVDRGHVAIGFCVASQASILAASVGVGMVAAFAWAACTSSTAW